MVLGTRTWLQVAFAWHLSQVIDSLRMHTRRGREVAERATAGSIQSRVASGEAVEAAMRPRAYVFSAKRIAEHVPYKDKRPGFPKALQGIFWLDESGYYGCETQSDFAPQKELKLDGYALTFANGKMDLIERSYSYDFTGAVAPSSPQTWADNLGSAESATFSIKWNTDYTSAIVKDYFKAWGHLFQRSTKLVNAAQPLYAKFTIKMQSPPSWCPAPDTASCEVKSKCAQFVRQNHIGPIGLRRTLDAYFLFRIVDEHGTPIQPYFDKFVKFSNQDSLQKRSPQSKYDVSLTFNKRTVNQLNSFFNVRGLPVNATPAVVYFPDEHDSFSLNRPKTNAKGGNKYAANVVGKARHVFPKGGKGDKRVQQVHNLVQGLFGGIDKSHGAEGGSAAADYTHAGHAKHVFSDGSRQAAQVANTVDDVTEQLRDSALGWFKDHGRKGAQNEGR